MTDGHLAIIALVLLAVGAGTCMWDIVHRPEPSLSPTFILGAFTLVLSIVVAAA